jgi:hypothetical protein
MSKRILLSTSSELHTLEMSSIDQRLFMVVERRALPNGGNLQKVIWWASSDTLRFVPRVPLLAEVRAVVVEIARDFEWLTYAYTQSFDCTDAGGTVISTSGSGGSSGHRLPGDSDHAYAIVCGFGICDLVKLGSDAQGQGVLIETTDCRRLKEIETVNNGTVVIKKRKIKTNLAKLFADLQTFLERQSAETIGISKQDD